MPAYSKDDLNLLAQLWDEYRYRHDLCWRIIAQVTVASISLAALPYVDDKVTVALNPWIVAVPVLAVVVVAFGALVVANELSVLEPIKAKYRERQAPALGISKRDSGRFRLYVSVYFAALLALALMNVAVLLLRWLPVLPIAACVTT